MDMTTSSVLVLLVLVAAAAADVRHIIQIVGDDVGYNDLGFTNGKRVVTPNLDELREQGVFLSNYYSFKICSPTRSALHSGRYPWGAGFYDMSEDLNHCLQNYTLLPELLKQQGYATHAIGKYDIGFINRECTATYKGYDTFMGYYTACQRDYWYHGASGGADDCNCTDFSLNEGKTLTNFVGYNNTYNQDIFTQRAVDLITAHSDDTPLYIYLAYMNVHAGCGEKLGVQAPLSSVERYSNVELDTYKVAAAMYTELDNGVGRVVEALKAKGMWNETLLVFVSDNGGPLDHATNYPLRGGKHTFFEGGVRVMSFISSPALPREVWNTTYDGMAHASDWYKTFVEGVAKGTLPAKTGPREPDGFNLWPSLLDGTASPRTEVVHQVNNSYFSEGVTSIRVGELKLIRGNPGDERTVAFPQHVAQPVPLGLTGAEIEPFTDHVRAPGTGAKPNTTVLCNPFCLFNLTADLSEQHDLALDPSYAKLAAELSARLDAAGATGGPQAFLYWNETEYKSTADAVLAAGSKRGFLQPHDF